MGILASGTKTAYDAEFTESVQTLEHTKKFMEKCIAGIQNSVKVCVCFVAFAPCSLQDYNSSNSVNRYEKIGDAINKYGAKCLEAEVANYLQSGKATYDQVGRAFRVYASQVTEKVIEPLATWVKVRSITMRARPKVYRFRWTTRRCVAKSANWTRLARTWTTPRTRPARCPTVCP